MSQENIGKQKNENSEIDSQRKNSLKKAFVVEIPSCNDSLSTSLSVKSNYSYETLAPVCFSPMRSVNNSEQFSFCQSNNFSYDKFNNTSSNQLTGYARNESNNASSATGNVSHLIINLKDTIKGYFGDVLSNLCTEKILITNLPSGVREADVINLCSGVPIKTIKLRNATKSNGLFAHVTVENSKAGDTLFANVNNKIYHGNKLKVMRIHSFA